MSYEQQIDAAKPTRTYVAVTAGPDGEKRATFLFSKSDWQYIAEGKSFCGKTVADPEGTAEFHGKIHTGLVHVKNSKINAIIEQGCSMLKHLPEDVLDVQRAQYNEGRQQLGWANYREALKYRRFVKAEVQDGRKVALFEPSKADWALDLDTIDGCPIRGAYLRVDAEKLPAFVKNFQTVLERAEYDSSLDMFNKHAEKARLAVAELTL